MIRVGIATRHDMQFWRLFPTSEPVWGGCHFIFGPDFRACDYLVVLDDVQRPLTPGVSSDRWIHISGEPPTVHRYGERYLAQFALSATLDETNPHPASVLYPPCLPWFVGWNMQDPTRSLGYQSVASLALEPRVHDLSIIASAKAFTTGHRQRLDLVTTLKRHFGLRATLRGRGFAPLGDKADALRGYRFHVAIENSSFPHYFTEKLLDPLLTGTVPIYAGCPNLADYGLADAVVSLPIDDPAEAILTIERCLAGESGVTPAALESARQKVLGPLSPFGLIARLVEGHNEGLYGAPRPPQRSQTLQPQADFAQARRPLLVRASRVGMRLLRRFSGQLALPGRRSAAAWLPPFRVPSALADAPLVLAVGQTPQQGLLDALIATRTPARVLLLSTEEPWLSVWRHRSRHDGAITLIDALPASPPDAILIGAGPHDETLAAPLAALAAETPLVHCAAGQDPAKWGIGAHHRAVSDGWWKRRGARQV